MGVVAPTLKWVMLQSALTRSRVSSFFSTQAYSQLPHSRFAKLHELSPLLSPTLETLRTGLLLGTAPFNQVACVRPTKTRRELGNVLACAPPRAGKSLHAIAQLLAFTGGSVIVNDVKGELYAATAGFRRTLGPVYVIDPQGFGNAYDPLQGKTTEDELLSLATHLLFEGGEGEGKIFTDRAITMLMILFLAARMEGIAPFPSVRLFTQLGLADTAAHLHRLNPILASRFLDENFLNADLKSKFLLSCWSTLKHRLQPLLTETVIRSLTHSDFTPAELLCGKRPVSVYIRWREQHLLALSPLVRLLWGSLINELTTCYDQQAEHDLEQTCRPVLLLIDEGGRTAIPLLHDATSTVCGRGISIWLVIQSLEQLSAVYGRDRGNIIRGNCETQLYYRPNDLSTASYLEARLGTASVYAHSQTLRHGEETSEGRSERPTPLLTSQDIALLTDQDVIAFHRNYRPLKLTRMDWRDYPLLTKRRTITPPSVEKLPPLTDEEMRTTTLMTHNSPTDDDEGLINPQEIAKRRTPA
jgi:type IV secretion system protein VirD4